MTISFFYPSQFLYLSSSILCWHPNPCAGGTGIFSADSVGLPSIRTEGPQKRIASYLKAPEVETNSLLMLVLHSPPIYHTKTCPHMPTHHSPAAVSPNAAWEGRSFIIIDVKICVHLISEETVRHWVKRVRATGIKAKQIKQTLPYSNSAMSKRSIHGASNICRGLGMHGNRWKQKERKTALLWEVYRREPLNERQRKRQIYSQMGYGESMAAGIKELVQ